MKFFFAIFQKLVDFPGFEPETPIIGFSQWSVTNCEFTIKFAACCGKIKSPYQTDMQIDLPVMYTIANIARNWD